MSSCIIGLLSATADIRDIKGPITYGLKSPIIPIAGLILIFLIGLFILYIIIIAKKREAPLPPRPHEIAYEALQKLKERELQTKGRIEDYYDELSRILRNYLRDRFSLRAPEMTTEELSLWIEDSKIFSQEQKSLLKKLFIHFDLVKFAGYRPPAEEIDWTLEIVQRIVDQTKENAET